MQLDPQFTGAFSEFESAKMQKIYRLASNQWSNFTVMTDDMKCKLASTIIYVCHFERQNGYLSDIDYREIASEALKVRLELPSNMPWPELFRTAS